MRKQRCLLLPAKLALTDVLVPAYDREQKIQTKDEVLAELMAEHVALKKRVGEL